MGRGGDYPHVSGFCWSSALCLCGVSTELMPAWCTECWLRAALSSLASVVGFSEPHRHDTLEFDFHIWGRKRRVCLPGSHNSVSSGDPSGSRISVQGKEHRNARK